MLPEAQKGTLASVNYGGNYAGSGRVQAMEASALSAEGRGGPLGPASPPGVQAGCVGVVLCPHWSHPNKHEPGVPLGDSQRVAHRRKALTPKFTGAEV